MKSNHRRGQRRGTPPRYRDELLGVFARVGGKDALDAFLHDLLTPKEYHDLVLRWQIVKRLAQGETQRAVAGELWVGIATVIRGARALNESKGGFRSLLSE